MEIKSVLVAPGVDLSVIPSEKFKSNYFSLNFLLPLSEENITRCNLLSAVLIRGCEKYPTSAELGRHIAMLYDPDISVRTVKTPYTLIFRVNAYFLDNRFIPEKAGEDIFEDILSLLSELLVFPLLENGGLKPSYLAIEKKNQLDRIRSRINNKNSYALYRCERLALGDIPYACDALGTPEELEKATPESLYKLLRTILEKSRLHIVYSGSYKEGYREKITRFAKLLTAERNEEDIIPIPKLVLPVDAESVRDEAECIDAFQSRLVLAYSMGKAPENTAPLQIFNEIFGASPVSRLFMNVRERLNLCYYCSSVQQSALGIMYVVSGISAENRERVIKETELQLKELCDPDNITEEDMKNAVESLLSAYRTLSDSPISYTEWVISREISGRSTDTDKYVSEIKAVTKKDVAGVAKKARLKINYFLNGVAERGPDE